MHDVQGLQRRNRRMNSAGTMAKYLATSLAIEKVVSVPRQSGAVCRFRRSRSGASRRVVVQIDHVARPWPPACRCSSPRPRRPARQRRASLVPSPIMATSLPDRCSRRMYSSLSSGSASAMKSSTPAFSAMYFAVSGFHRPSPSRSSRPSCADVRSASADAGLDDVLQFDHAPDLLVR